MFVGNTYLMVWWVPSVRGLSLVIYVELAIQRVPSVMAAPLYAVVQFSFVYTPKVIMGSPLP
ncbi:hypothetical protein, partial [Paratractidigestivibacter sp.]|uniref:hypothetical protein n=1 Tax=Paratractidigestivibacter sp. TaxID=2847316 RepID=UPI002ABD3D9F